MNLLSGWIVGFATAILPAQADVPSLSPTQPRSPGGESRLGNLLSDAHEAERASRAYRLAINSGHPEQAPLACINLGNLLRHQEDNEGAAERYREAMAFGHPECAAHGDITSGLSC